MPDNEKPIESVSTPNELEPKRCVSVTCLDPVEVRVSSVTPSPLPGEWWTDEFGFRHPAPNPFGLTP